MTTEKTTHTPGAIRAAEQIAVSVGDDRDAVVWAFAAIIDRETGVAALLEACKVAIGFLDSHASDAARGALVTAIAKAEGGAA